MSARTSLLHPCRSPRLRGLLAGAAGAGALTLALALGTAVAAPSPAQAATFCGNYSPVRAAKTSTRYSRVRARACLEIKGTTVRGIAQGVVDKPLKCTSSAVPVPVPYCDVRLWAQFHGFVLRVIYSGKTIQCKFSGINNLLGGPASFACPAPARYVAPGGTVGTKAEMCFDVKDDGSGYLCTKPASFSRRLLG